jgi:hypothetical protein
VVIAALEAYVTDDKKPPGLRLKAFSMLFKSWASLREDDMQRCKVRTLKWLGELVIGRLDRTKTTGKTKRIKELPITVWDGCGITSELWLPHGHALMMAFGDPERDYLLPTMSADFCDAGNDPLPYTSSAALTVKVMQDLRVPIFENGTWTTTSEKLLHPILCNFWSEHSARNLLASLLILLGEDQKTIDMCGRWSPSGSQEYFRTHRTVVSNLQRKVCNALRTVDKRLNDWDVIERLDRFFSDRNIPDNLASEVRKHLIARIEDFRLERLKPEQIAWASCFEFESVTLSSLSTLPSQNLVTVTQAQPPQSASAAASRLGKFLVVYSRNRKFARLHRTDSGCHWAKAHVKDCKELDSVSPEAYNARCKFCWPQAHDAEDSASSQSED